MVATKCRNLLAAIDAARGRRFTTLILPFAICDARKRGSRFAPPLLPWDGVASSYPTDATICRTGAVFAICDNGSAVHQVDSGAADRLRVVQILDVLQLLRVVPSWNNSRAYRVTKCCSAGGETDSAASNACGYPNAADGATPFPTFRRAVFSGFVHPGGRSVKRLRRLDFASSSPMSLSMRARMYGFYISQHRPGLDLQA